MLYALTEARQAIDALREAIRLSALVEHVAEGVERRQVKTVFDAIRLGLQRSAGVSRVFWPGRAPTREAQQAAVERAAELRTATGLPDDPDRHIMGRRAWRDFVEHLDERMDAFFSTNQPEFLFIETVLHHGRRPDIEANTFLAYEPITTTLIFGQESYSLDDLIDGLEHVLAATSEALSGPYSTPT